MKIAVIGAAGFVGSAIAKAVKGNPNDELIKVFKNDDATALLDMADVTIHAANPSKRFRANSHPDRDFIETVDKTRKLIACVKDAKLILISSFSCRTQLGTAYGKNRRECEVDVLAAGGTVIRLGPMFGGDRTQDTLHDILSNKNVYVSEKSRYAYVDVTWAGEKILEFVDAKSGIYEIGARNDVSLGELRDIFESSSHFSGFDDTQIPDDAEDGPDANLVIEYARKELRRLDEWKF